jgi:hypothetical protein
MSEVTVPMDDKELMSAAMSDAPIAEKVEAPEPAPVAEASQDRPRDENGRFAPKAADEPAPVEKVEAEQPEKEQGIPSWRLKEEAEARREAIREAEELRRQNWQRDQELAQLRQQLNQYTAPKQELIDPYSDLEGAIRQRMDPLQSQLQFNREQTKFATSEMLMRDKIGDEKFEELRSWALARTNDPAFEAKVMRSAHPWNETMRIQKQELALKEVGDDPAAYRQRILEEALKDPAYVGRAIEVAKTMTGSNGQKPAPNISLPPSLNKASSSLSNEAADNDMSDAALYRYAIAR